MKHDWIKQARTRLIVVLLSVIMVVTGSIYYLQQSKFLHENMRLYLEHTVELFSVISVNIFETKDASNIKDIIRQWGEGDNNIAAIRLINAQGQLIAHYENVETKIPGPGFKRRIEYGVNKFIDMEVIANYKSIHSQLNQLAMFLVINIVLMIAVLVYLLRRLAIGSIAGGNRYQIAELLDHMPVAVCLKDINGKLLTANQMYRDLYGNLSDQNNNEIENTKWDEIKVKLVDSNEVAEFEHYGAGKSQDEVYLNKYFPLETANGEINSIGNIIFDISDYKRTYKELENTTRMAWIFSEINSGVLRNRNEREWLQEVCRVLVEIGGYKLVWIGVAQKEGSKNIIPVADAGYDEGYLPRLGLTWDDVPRGRGPVGTAVRENKFCIIRDTLKDETFEPWRHDAVERGYRSVCAIPFDMPQAQAVLALYASETDAFNESEMRFLRNLINDISAGLQNIRFKSEAEKSQILLFSEKQKFEKIIHGIKAGVLLLDSETHILWANEIFKKWFGDESKLYGAPSYKVFNIIDPESQCPSLMSVKSHETQSRQVTVDLSNGNRKYFEIVSAPLFDEHGDVFQVVVLVQDVTARYLLEKETRDKEHRLNEAQRLAHIGSWEYDLSSKIFRCSDEALRIFELDKKVAEPSYRFYLNSIHPGDRDKVDKLYAESLENKQAYEVVYRLMLHAGTIKYVHERCETEYTDEGKAMRSLGTVQDITNQVKVEQALLESEDLFKQLVESTTAIPWEINPISWQFTYVGPQAEKLLGYPVSQWYTNDFWLGQIHPEDKDDVMLFFKNASENDSDRVVEFRMRTSDARYIWIQVIAKVIRHDGDIDRIQGFMFDITEKRNAEEMLRHSVKMDAVGKLTGGIAHDFNNQLGIVQGYLDFLDEFTRGQEKPHRWVGAASKAARRCIELSRKLLDFSRKNQVQAEPVNINSIFNKMNDLIERSVTPKIEVNYTLEDGLWVVELNAGELEDAILNLVLNARDAMPAGGVLSIRTQNYILDEGHSQYFTSLPAGDYVRIDIEDTGVGINKENKEHIFEPFFTTKAEGQGTGLGLAMVYSFVQRSGGEIIVHSETNEGACFHIYVPRYYIPADIKDVTALTNNIGLQAKGKGEIILVVDDEKELQELAIIYLEMLGYRTLKASSSVEALAIIESDESIDLLFTDVIMPGALNGYELAEKTLAIRPDIKIILTSGFTGNAIESDLYPHAQHAPLLNKPYSKLELSGLVNSILHKKDSESFLPARFVDDPVTGDEHNISIGYKPMDDEHDVMFSILNQYRHAVESNSVDFDAMSLLEKLITETRAHFMREEALMKACEYPHYHNHCQVHDMLIKMAEDLLAAYKNNPEVFDHIATINFLEHWLISHIMSMDKAYVSFVQGHEDDIDDVLSELTGFVNFIESNPVKPRLVVVDDEESMGALVCEVAETAGLDSVHYISANDFIFKLDEDIDFIILDLLMPDIDGVEMIRLLADKNSKAALVLISGVDKSVLHSAQELAFEHGLNVAGTLQKPFYPHELKKLLDGISADIAAKPSYVHVSSETNAIDTHDLLNGIRGNQFIGYYQPQISIKDMRIVGFEALLRWKHPERGLITPYHFIQLAESSGMIDEITWQLFEQIAYDWTSNGLDCSVSLNMTAGMFKDLSLPERFNEIGKKYSFSDNSQLILEVTESALMEELTKSLDSLTRLRMKGFQLSIDDFGTGFSSMMQLYRAPFTELKIDQSFVMRIDRDQEARTIVESTINLAHNLNMKVVAEGVETDAILRELQKFGCDIAQGYFFAKPMPIDEMMSWLRLWNERHS
ncbi:MAG TPA: EAL domain-containing protein [Gammaproteobacteria bacterium]